MIRRIRRWALGHYWDSIDTKNGPTLKEWFWCRLWKALYLSPLVMQEAKKEPQMLFKERN